MDWLNIRLNRKTFFAIIVVLVLIYAYLQFSLGQAYVDNMRFLIATWVVLLLVLCKWRSNDIGLNNKEFLFNFVIMFIPLIGLLSVGNFLLSKGGSANPYEYEDVVFSSSLSADGKAVLDDITVKYKPYLNGKDYVHNTEIAQSLFELCQATPSLDAILTKNNATFSRFILAYTAMKRENLLWDSTENYLPFLALTTEKTLDLLLQGDTVSNFNLNILKGIFKCKDAEIAEASSVASNVPKLAGKLTGLDSRKIWLLVFFIVSLGMMFWPPYHTVFPNNKGIEFAGYGTISEPPSSVSKKNKMYTSIDYSTLAFHEVMLLVVCGAGYTITTMVKKK